MKLMSLKQYKNMTKVQLVRKIMKALKKLPKRNLVKLCYELEKRRLPSISTTKKDMPKLTGTKAFERKKPRSKKQLANDKRLGKRAKARARQMRKR